ncbi:Adenosine 5'-monophosphoramidase [Neonectria magnoliae]|uniref:Adenosine 5'-monophosphoramidase n=1 Tax=Neonectria magnoliae TaxID=2732573 RepID=A0ABR1HYM8_9HYPO
MASAAACIFCKIIKGKFNKIPTLIASREIPSMKLFESEKVFAFLDIGPLSKGHALVIPKFHGAKLTDIPDDELIEVLPTLKKIIKASGATDYNILQNNGTIAHQQVHHVHFHMIPKPNETEGLGIRWPTLEADTDQLKALCEDIKSRI